VSGHFLRTNLPDIPSDQWRQSGLKSGGVVDPRKKMSIFSRQFLKKIQLFEANIFPGKFPKKFDFSDSFQAKILK